MKPRRHILAFLAYVLPTLPLGVVWHLVVFKNYYDELEVYREDFLIPFGILSMTVQGIAYAYIYYRLFRHETVIRGAVKFFFLCGFDRMEFHGYRGFGKTPYEVCLRFRIDRNRIYCSPISDYESANSTFIFL